jgi:hypothetical protein
MSLPALLLTVLQSLSGQTVQEPRYPFAVGDSLEYSAKLGFIRLGTGYIQIPGIDTVQGVPNFVFRFALTGGNFLYRLDSVLESRTGVFDLKSRRYESVTDENGTIRKQRYDIYPDSGFYRQNGEADPKPTTDHPLDDAAFLFFVRTVPLQVGETYRLDYYFRKEKNPLVLRVEKREKMDLPDGTSVDCLVVWPIIGDRGLFAERQQARVWLTDDTRRIPVQITTRYPFGVITLRLLKMKLGTPSAVGG